MCPEPHPQELAHVDVTFLRPSSLLTLHEVLVFAEYLVCAWRSVKSSLYVILSRLQAESSLALVPHR